MIERHAHSRVEYMIKARSQFKRRSTANHVEVVVPVPADADTPKFKTSVGSVRYVPEQNVLIWSIKSFPVCPVSAFLNIATDGDEGGKEDLFGFLFFIYVTWLRMASCWAFPSMDERGGESL